jgi:hypothetical protein
VKQFNDAFNEKVRPLLAARDYDKAQKLFDQLAQQDAIKRAPEEAEPFRTDIRRLKLFWENAARKAETLKAGQKLAIGGKDAKLVSCKDGTLRYRIGTAETSVGLRELKARDAADLLDPADDEGRLLAAACLLYDKDADPTRALQVLRKAGKGGDAERYLELAKSMGATETAEPATAAAPKDTPKGPGLLLPESAKGDWQRLFDGKSLKGWTPVGPSLIYLQNGGVAIEEGYNVSGIAWKGEFPNSEYEVALDAMRDTWFGTFCGIVFPVGDEYYTATVGSVGDRVALETPYGPGNTRAMKFVNDRWYHVRVVVSQNRVQLWVDRQKVIDSPVVKREGFKYYSSSYRQEFRPFGIFTNDAKGVIRNIGMRRMQAEAAK